MSMEYRSLFDTDTDTLLSEISTLEQQQQVTSTATTATSAGMYATSATNSTSGSYGGGVYSVQYGSTPNTNTANTATGYPMGYSSGAYYATTGQQMIPGPGIKTSGYGPSTNQQHSSGNFSHDFSIKTK